MRELSHDWKTPKNDPPLIYSSEKALMDYITVKGIRQRTGIEKSELIVFMLKELLDNALDFLETYGSRRNEDEPIVKIDITGSKIIVSNSNFGRQSFNKDRLNSIFTIDTFVSSKRNIYRISRGHLGDALKSVISIPNAIATDCEIVGWNKPMIIREGKFTYLIHLNVDRVSQSIMPNIEIQMTETLTHEIGFTSIEVTFPEKKNMNYYPSDLFLRDYARLNPHITFHIDITQNGDTIYRRHKGLILNGQILQGFRIIVSRSFNN